MSRLNFRIDHRPSFPLLTVALASGEQVFAEPSAMVGMTPEVELRAGLRRGLWRSMGRMLGGESLVMNTFTAARGAGEVSFAAGQMGDMLHHRLDGAAGLFLQRGGFVAHGLGVEVDGSWQGARGFFSGEGLILLRASGTGDLFFNSYGTVFEIPVDGSFIVDTGYIVAFEETLTYRVRTVPGLGRGAMLKTFFFGGERLVVEFSGRGRVWVQTREISPWLRFLWPYRPSSS